MKLLYPVSKCMLSFLCMHTIYQHLGRVTHVLPWLDWWGIFLSTPADHRNVEYVHNLLCLFFFSIHSLLLLPRVMSRYYWMSKVQFYYILINVQAVWICASDIEKIYDVQKRTWIRTYLQGLGIRFCTFGNLGHRYG